MSTVNNGNIIESVYIRSRGKSFCVVYHYTDTQGKRRQKGETYRNEADAIKRKLELEYLQSVSQLIRPNDMTFEQVFQRYLEFYAETKYKPNYYRNFKQQVALHVLPEIGSRYIQDIKPLDIERFMKKVRTKKKYDNHDPRAAKGENLSSSTVASIYTYVNQIFNKAVKWKLISSSPVECDRPIVTNDEMSIWAPEDVQRALGLMRSEGKDMLELCLHISYICTARKGEVAGLTWDDINNKDCTVTISKQLLRVDKEALEKTQDREKPILVFPGSKESSKSVLVIMSLKTKKSKRTLTVPRPFMDRLMERKKEYEHQKRVYSEIGTFHDYGLVISHPSGEPVDPRRINTWLDKFQRKHPEFTEIAFHGIRHSSASYKMSKSGGDIKTVQSEGGWTTTNVLTERYAHVLPNSNRTLIDAISKDFYSIEDELKPSTAKTKVSLDGLIAQAEHNPELKKKLNELFSCLD